MEIEYPGVPISVSFPAMEVKGKTIVFVPEGYTYVQVENTLMLVKIDSPND